MAIVYQHKRNDTNEVFYVGIGKSKKRAYSKHHRSKHWQNIANKAGFAIELLFLDVAWKEACLWEKQLIAKLGRIDLGTGLLVNQTEGGEGIINISPELRQKRKDFWTTERKQELSRARTGKKQSQEAKRNQILGQTGRKLSEESIRKRTETKKRNKNLILFIKNEQTV